MHGGVVVNEVYAMLVQGGLPVTERDLPMPWEDLDQDLLATMPPRTRSQYRWDGAFAPYEGDLHCEEGSDDVPKSRASRKVAKRPRTTDRLGPESTWVEATSLPSWW